MTDGGEGMTTLLSRKRFNGCGFSFSLKVPIQSDKALWFEELDASGDCHFLAQVEFRS